jgi:hypothetical protein
MISISIVPEDCKRRVVATYGIYTVWYDPIVHVPWGLFRVYRGQKYCGAQISWPCASDCEWHDKWGGRYADSSFRDDKPYGWTAQARGVGRRRPGRPRKAVAEQELQEAIAA